MSEEDEKKLQELWREIRKGIESGEKDGWIDAETVFRELKERFAPFQT